MQLINGDCLLEMKSLPDNSVDSIVTDPPYGLSFMGKKWDYDVPSVEIWQECLRVLKPGGHLLAFAGTRTQHRMAVRIEDAGFEIRDMIAWVYGSGFPKSHNLKDKWQGWGTALKPALEPITVARKPLIGTVAENVLTHGTGALNIDACRVGTESRPVMVRTDTVVSATSMSGESTGATSNGEITNLGRWPANLIHDGSEEVTQLFPYTKSGKGVAGTGGNGEGTVYNESLGSKKMGRIIGDSGSASRFFYMAKAGRKERYSFLTCNCEKDGRFMGVVVGATSPLSSGISRCAGCGCEVRKVGHPTQKPTDLMRYLCKLVTRPGGTVLDPFMGSGSTGKAAKLEGFEFIGIELDPEYCKIAEARINSAT